MNIHEVYYSPMNTVGDDERKDWEDMYIKKYLKMSIKKYIRIIQIRNI